MEPGCFVARFVLFGARQNRAWGSLAVLTAETVDVLSMDNVFSNRIIKGRCPILGRLSVPVSVHDKT